MSNEEEIILDRLEQIRESIHYIQEWSRLISKSDEFLMTMDNVMRFNACVMRLQVIGEHVGKLLKLSPCPLDKYTEIQWKSIYGMRNLISHEYANINEEIVFSTIKYDIPILERVMSDLISEYKEKK